MHDLEQDQMDQESDHHEWKKRCIDAADRQAIEADAARRSVKPKSHSGGADRFGMAPESFPGYIIQRTIKRGGQGIVYEAIHQATNRPVAIKVGYDSILRDPMSRVRISREVDALSRLRHPNIVRLTDGGEINGRFYFVTDYIDGCALDEHLAATDYSMRELVSLFATICDAVHAAHRRGIVHRDLKPSNIIIDERSCPHILDFGLAKLTEVNEETARRWEQMTITGQFLGSLPWATPEQVEGASDLIDCRTDVYALGVMLYHALTHRFPYDVCTSTRVAMDNILQADPVPLRAEDSKLGGDLETIVLKCLSKSPDRRYQDAGALAVELRRFLTGDPISARRDSRCYVISRIVRKHRVVAAVVAAVITMTVVYALTMTVLYQRATDARKSATAAATRERVYADAQHETLAFMVGEVSSQLANIPGAIRARRSVLEGAYQRLTVLEADAAGDPKLRAVTLGMLGDILQALGEYDGALVHLREARWLYEGLSDADPNNSDVRADLSVALVRVGDVLGDLADYTPRRALYDRALAIDKAIAAKFPEDRHYRDNLLWSYERTAADDYRAGDMRSAQARFRKQRDVAAQLTAEEPEKPARAFALQRALRHLNNTAARLGDPELAHKLMDDLLTLTVERAERFPADPETLFQLTDTYLRAGHHASSYGQDERATEFYELALRSHQESTAAFGKSTSAPNDERRLLQLSKIYDNLGQMQRRAGDFDRACRYFSEALAAADRACYLAPHSFESQWCVFQSLTKITTTLEHGERDEAAEIYSQRAVRMGEQMLENKRAAAARTPAIARFLMSRIPSAYRDITLMIDTLEMATSDKSDPPTASDALLGLLYQAAGDTPRFSEAVSSTAGTSGR